MLIIIRSSQSQGIERDTEGGLKNLVEEDGRGDGCVLEWLEAQLLLEAEEQLEESGDEDVVTHPLAADGHRRKLDL